MSLIIRLSMRLLAACLFGLQASVALAQYSDLIYDCSFGPDFGGDRTTRGFYVENFPANSLGAVIVSLASAGQAGQFTITMTAREGSYDGPFIGSVQRVVDLTTDVTGTEVDFNFANAPVTPGATVTFAMVVSEDPDDYGYAYYDTGDGTDCPDVSETNGTSPPLDSFRREAVGLLIYATSTTPYSPFVINQGINDAWYYQATAGQGFFIIVLPNQGKIFMAWFTFDTELPPEDVLAILGDPSQRWLTAQGPYAGNTANLDVYLTKGGVFDMPEPDPDTIGPIGTITIVWQDCEHGTLTYDIPELGLMGVIPISRIVPDNVGLCEFLEGV